jgi:hypothetical protein
MVKSSHDHQIFNYSKEQIHRSLEEQRRSVEKGVMVAANELDTLFSRAFEEPGIRPAFYRLLMHSDVLVLTVDRLANQPPAFVTFLRDDGAQVVPVFTSEKALSREAPTVGHAEPKITLMAMRRVMELTRGLHLHINPHSPFSRDFSPAEVASLLKDETVHAGMRTPETLSAGIEIQLKAIRVSMPVLEAALTQVFVTAPDVHCAFLVEVERERDGRLIQTLMVAINAKPSKDLASAVSTIFSDVYVGSLRVDLCFDHGDVGIIDTLRQIGARPFFDRKSPLGRKCPKTKRERPFEDF